MKVALYLDQNYLSGMVKRKPAFRELEPVLRAAVVRGAVSVPESSAHRIESEARPDLPLLDLLRELSGGERLPDQTGERERMFERRLAKVAEEQFPERRRRDSDRIDLLAISLALTHCQLITCDAFVADVIRRAGLDRRLEIEIFSGRRAEVDRLSRRLQGLD
jgi:hypothetical protein